MKLPVPMYLDVVVDDQPGITTRGFLSFRCLLTQVDPDQYVSFSDPARWLYISAQTDTDHASDPQPVYGWDIKLRSTSGMDLREAEAGVKLLRSIDAGLRRLDQRYGPVATFAQWLTRIGDVLGVAGYRWNSDPGPDGEPLDARAIQARINDRLTDYALDHPDEISLQGRALAATGNV